MARSHGSGPVSRRIQSRRHCKRQRVRQAHTCTHLNLIFCWVSVECFNPRLVFSGRTPLNVSSPEGHVEVCQFLVASKADVIAKDNEYESYPYIRIQTCGCEFVICFERFNSRLFVSGRTPLHWSSEGGHLEVCQLLVASKADVIAKDNLYDSYPYTRIQTCGLRLF